MERTLILGLSVYKDSVFLGFTSVCKHCMRLLFCRY